MAKATSMAELMAKKAPQIKSFKKGEKVTGKITKLHKNEILIDIGAKTEAVVLEKEKSILDSILSMLSVGDSVEVSVLNPESDQGHPVVSLRRFMDEKVWGKLDKLKTEGKTLEVLVNSHTKGGFLVTTEDGMQGFLPNSQMTLSDSPGYFIGKKIKVVTLEVNRSTHKIIFSQKAATTDEEFKTAVKDIKVDSVVDVVVSNTTSFGIFVSIKNSSPTSQDNKQKDQALEGFIHLSEISWDNLESAENIYKIGDKLSARVIGIDKDGKRINLSIKKLSEDPFQEQVKEYGIDKKVKGEVKKKSSIGLIIDLDGMEGMIKKDKIPPSSKYDVGDSIEAIVSEIDARRHRIILVPVLKEKPIGYR